MARKAPRRSNRVGLTVIELFKLFPDDAAAEAWFEKQRWPECRFCPDCGFTRVAVVASRKPMPYRCRDCRRHFSVRKGTVMEASKIGLQKWAIALYMMTTGLKGTSSMKLYREVGIRQATAWFLMQRIREGFVDGVDKPFPGPVQADTLEQQMSVLARGFVGKRLKYADLIATTAAPLPEAGSDVF